MPWQVGADRRRCHQLRRIVPAFRGRRSPAQDPGCRGRSAVVGCAGRGRNRSWSQSATLSAALAISSSQEPGIRESGVWCCIGVTPSGVADGCTVGFRLWSVQRIDL